MAYTDYTYLDSDDASLRVYPTTPETIKPRSINVEILQPTLTTVTNDLTTQRRSLGVHRIELEYTYPAMTSEQLQPFVAFFTAMQGQAKAFKLKVPKELINDTQHKTDSDVHTVTTGYAKGIKEVIVDNFGNSLDPAIKGGNFIQFNNHDKIYVVAADGISHTDGTCKIRFEPALLEAVTSSTTLNTFNEDIPFHVIFDSSAIKFDVDSALLYGFKIKFTEQWKN